MLSGRTKQAIWNSNWYKNTKDMYAKILYRYVKFQSDIPRKYILKEERYTLIVLSPR